MKRRNLTPQQNAESITFNAELGLKHAILREPSLVDDFFFEPCKPSDDSEESFSICDPIYMMFNQERLSNMGATAAKAFLDSLVPKSNGELVELRKKCSDDDLMSIIKSRHLQSPAEILAWCRYVNDDVEQFNSEYAKVLADKQTQETKKYAVDNVVVEQSSE